MITKVVIRNFKRFDEVTFDLPGNVVVAGPNNTGKTTLLQAIAAWNFALKKWKDNYDYQKHGGGFTKVPISRPSFSAVPLRTFELLFRDRKYAGLIEIEIYHESGWDLTMEIHADTTEQIYVRPKSNRSSEEVRNADLDVVYVPPMSGLSVEEPVYQAPYIEQRLASAKPGEILRNLLVQAHNSTPAWTALQETIERLFGYEIHPPNDRGASIIAEYSMVKNGTRYDISSGGSGFQQVLMLLTFLNTRPASVLLLDEPDAHLHIILQDAIFGVLQSVAAKQNSQLLIATHSAEIINSADPRSICVVLRKPKLLAGDEERRALIKSLSVLSNADITVAEGAKGILYTEDYTDLEILKAWALKLNHPFAKVLPESFLWKKMVIESREGASGVRAKDHYDAIRLVKEKFPGLILIDGDAKAEINSTEITGNGFQRLRWNRYEIESYLLHPRSLERFLEKQLGQGDLSAQGKKDLKEYFQRTYPPGFLNDPFEDLPFIKNTKARTELLPPALTAGGLPAFPYQRYFEIAEVMLPDEIHPEVKEKLDLIMKALGL
jgi:AAA domain, putative AbiEii toxin, Type IV TA system/AAA ATPase domain